MVIIIMLRSYIWKYVGSVIKVHYSKVETKLSPARNRYAVQLGLNQSRSPNMALANRWIKRQNKIMRQFNMHKKRLTEASLV